MTATAPAAPAHVREIARYVPGKSIEEVARDLNLDPKSIVKLASNENPRGPSPRVLAAIAQAAAEVTRYPDGNGFALKAALSERLGVAPSADRARQRLERRPGTGYASVSCAPATKPSMRSMRSPCIRSRPRRAAASASKCRPGISDTTFPGCEPRSRRARASCSSPIRTIRPARSWPARNSRRSSTRFRATCSWCWMRHTTNTSNRRSAATA